MSQWSFIEVDMSDIVFNEWVPAGSLAKAIVAFVSLVIFSVLSITVITGVAFQNPFWISVSVSVLAFLLLLFWNYRGMRIQVNKERLSVDYGLFNHKTIQLSDMVSCEPTKASFIKYGGVGIRLGLDGSWAYTTSLGHAVRIQRMSGRPFVFSTSTPEEVCNIVNQMRARKSTWFSNLWFPSWSRFSKFHFFLWLEIRIYNALWNLVDESMCAWELG